MSHPIETPRLLLRNWRETDILPFSVLNGDPEVMEYFPKTLTGEESLALYNHIQDEFTTHGYGLYAVERREDGKFIGFTGLHRVTFDADFTPATEIAWRLVREAWNCGYATEAASACMEYAKTHIGLQEAYAFTTLANLRSQRVMQKTGMTRIGEFNHPLLPAGHPLSKHIIYKINF